MVRPDGMVAAITHEDGVGGITLLDLSDPAHPTVITRLTEGLEPSTHNLWIDSDYIYVAIDAYFNQSRSRLAVVDITNLQNPVVVATYDPGSRIMQDVEVRDGLAMVSNWEAGLIILDVGGGGAGGSPANPIELSRTPTPQGWTHAAFYWPATGYVFVNEEPQVEGVWQGTFYVMDVREPSSPQQVATYTIGKERSFEGSDPHDFWLDEDRGILYVAWHKYGVRAIDVSGTLMGELERQGCEIAKVMYDGSYDGPGTCGFDRTCSHSLQLLNGLVYVSDWLSGLWVLQPSF